MIYYIYMYCIILVGYPEMEDKPTVLLLATEEIAFGGRSEEEDPMCQP